MVAVAVIVVVVVVAVVASAAAAAAAVAVVVVAAVVVFDHVRRQRRRRRERRPRCLPAGLLMLAVLVFRFILPEIYADSREAVLRTLIASPRHGAAS